MMTVDEWAEALYSPTQPEDINQISLHYKCDLCDNVNQKLHFKVTNQWSMI